MSIIAPISQAPVFLNRTSDVTSSFSSTKSIEAPSADFLNNVMSSAVNLDNAEKARKLEISGLNPMITADQLRHSALNLESSAYIGAYKKAFDSLSAVVQKVVLT